MTIPKGGRWLLCVKCCGVTQCHSDADKIRFWYDLIYRLFGAQGYRSSDSRKEIP